MTELEQAQIRLTLSLLQQGRWLLAWSWFSGLLLALPPGSVVGLGWYAGLAIPLLYWFIRVELDARLFGWIAQNQLDLVALHQALHGFGLKGQAAAPSISAACQGALRWLKVLLLLVLIQTLGLLAICLGGL